MSIIALRPLAATADIVAFEKVDGDSRMRVTIESARILALIDAAQAVVEWANTHEPWAPLGEFDLLSEALAPHER